jgi:hypothetical protein
MCAACLKNSVYIYIYVEKIYKMGCLECSAVPVLYIGRTVPKGYDDDADILLSMVDKKREHDTETFEDDDLCGS